MAVKCILTGQTPSVLDGVTENVQTQIDAKAADNAVVHLTGNETISGTKTFTGGVVMKGGADVASSGNAILNVEGVATDTDYIDMYVSGGANAKRPLVLQNNSSGSGNVGIGTATPSEKLEIVGNVKATKFKGDGSELTNVPYPVTSVAGKTGAVTLAASDVGAQPKITVTGILQGDGNGNITAVESIGAEVVTLNKSDVGLGNVDNTSDANKPISNATQAALNDKQAKITASGLLKGDGAGGVTTAIKGTDYVASPEVFIATYGTTTSAEIEAAYQAGKPIIAIYPGKAIQYHIFQRSSATNHKFSTFAINGKFFTIQCSNDVWSDGQNSGVKPSAHASTHASGGTDPITPADIGAQPSITVNGILKGDGAGAVTAAEETEVELVDLPQEVFWATYGETTAAELNAAWDAGKLIKLKSGQIIYDLGIRFNSTDSFYFYSVIMTSSVGIARRVIFNATDGTWKTDIIGSICDSIASVSLPVASWTGSDPYTQTIHNIGSNASTKVDIQPSEEIYDQLVADNVGYLAIKNVDGTLTAVAKGGKPSVDLTVQVTYNDVY